MMSFNAMFTGYHDRWLDINTIIYANTVHGITAARISRTGQNPKSANFPQHVSIWFHPFFFRVYRRECLAEPLTEEQLWLAGYDWMTDGAPS